MPSGIFVIGKHRSGTTSLANQLCEYECIAAVQHENHWGVHESAFFDRLSGRYGSLGRWGNFREFVEVVEGSDYFYLTNIDKKYLLSLWPTNYYNFFKDVMDEYARRNGSIFWLEKSPSHTKYSKKMAKHIPNAKFVCIVRDNVDVVKSAINMNIDRCQSINLNKYLEVGKHNISWNIYYSYIVELKNMYPSRTKIIRFEDYCSRNKKIMEELEYFIDIPPGSKKNKKKYGINSSYNDAQSVLELNIACRLIIRVIDVCLGVLPNRVITYACRVKDNLKPKRTLPKWFFKVASGGSTH